MPKRGEPATPAQREALKRGQAKRAKMLKEGAQDVNQTTRWRMLLDGTLTVADLDDEEVERGRVYGKGKAFSGSAPRMPSHLIAAFKKERNKRLLAQFDQAAPRAIKRLLEIAEDPDEKTAEQLKAIFHVLDRSLGKVPDKVILEGGSLFDDLIADAADAMLDRDLEPEDG